MKHHLTILLAILFVLPSLANRYSDNEEILLKLNPEELVCLEDCDTIINFEQYAVRLIRTGNQTEHIGINLFSNEAKISTDKEMLDFVETALLAKLLGVEINGNTDFLFFGGDITTLQAINQETPCKISNLNSRFLSFEWNIGDDNVLRMDVPLSYYNAKGRNRGDIEDDFIMKIKNSDLKRVVNFASETKSLEPYGEGMYISPGQQYLKEEINRNLYFKGDATPKLILTPEYPLESISNLFISPNAVDSIVNIEVTVLKHEFGEKDTFITSLENLLASCEADGCLPYWGIEEFNEGYLAGTLFLYNWKQGYDHVFKIECDPNEVLNGTGMIKARASLFIPTNNIETLFDPDDE